MRIALRLAVVALLATPLMPPSATEAATVVAPAAAHIDLEVGKGRLIRLDHPATSVFIADPDVADIQVKSPSLVYVIGKGAGSTTLYAVGENDQVLANTEIVVRHDIARLQQALQKLNPDTAVDVSTVDDALVLSGTVFSAAEGEDVRRIAARFVPDQTQLINKMEIDEPNQINLRVRVAEMSRSVIKTLGFDWETALAPGKFLFGVATGQAFVPGTAILPGLAQQIVTPTVNTLPPQRQFLTGANGVDNGIVGFHSNRVDANALIDALDSEGLVTVLAEPNLTAVSGETASFLAGGEFPIPVPQQNGAITIDYKKFGVSLSFVGTIGAHDRISLRVRPEVSQLSSAGAIVIDSISVPSLTTRRAETTIELGSGQSFAIAGLLQNNVTNDLKRFPGLGDLPIIGALFRSTQFQRDESELVIIVTPYIVRPVSNQRLAAPTDGFVSPNDAERIIGGVSNRPQTVPSTRQPLARSGAGLLGPVGFDLD